MKTVSTSKQLKPSGIVGALLIGLFLAAAGLEALVALLFGDWHWLVAMIAGYGVIWWLTRYIPSIAIRIPLRAITAAILFTPFIPIAGIEWSSPWPPAVVWLASGLNHGKVSGPLLNLILASAAWLACGGWAFHVGRQSDSRQPPPATLEEESS